MDGALSIKLSLHNFILSIERIKSKGRVYGVGHPYYFYREGKYKAAILMESTPEDGRVDVVVYPSSLVTWLPPHDKEVIPIDKRKKIMSLLDEYLVGKLKVKYDVVEEPDYEKRVLDALSRGERIRW